MTSNYPVMQTHIVHADDHEIVTNTIKKMVEDHSPNFTVIATPRSYPELLYLLERIRVDILLLDGVIKDGTLDDNLPAIRKKYPLMKVILLWYWASQESLYKWKELLDGHLNLGCSTEELIEAIETVVKGEKYITVPISKR